MEKEEEPVEEKKRIVLHCEMPSCDWNTELADKEECGVKTESGTELEILKAHQYYHHGENKK